MCAWFVDGDVGMRRVVRQVVKAVRAVRADALEVRVVAKQH